MEITEHTFETPRHRTFYTACGPSDGARVVFVHGWPELGYSWRRQLQALGALGFRAIAPDMRGYGRSSAPEAHDAYALENMVADMIELLDGLGPDGEGRADAIWIGHDWGAPVVWALASHHSERARAVANLCIPYRLGLDGLDAIVELVNREIYPEDEYPKGPWDYMFHYLEDFAGATAEMDANPYNMVVAMFRSGDPAAAGVPTFTATIRKNGGWFPGPNGEKGGEKNGAPEMPLDPATLSEDDARVYADALTANGFFGPNSYYMNTDANAAYGARSPNGGRLDMPVLFIHAAYDFVCETLTSNQAKPMRALCTKLTEATIHSGHWVAQEKADELNAALAGWIAEVID